MRAFEGLMVGTAMTLATATPAMAQASQADGAELDSAIIVTAQRRAERTQDVPISITSITSEALRQANVQSLSDIAKLSPATRFDNSAIFVQPTIRGVGTSVVTSGGGANVGIYIDGFYSPNPVAADMQLLNVAGIQVLKGPQGTLFGRNTTGGAILVTSAKPSYDTAAIVDLSYSRFDTRQLQGYFTTGLNDKIAVDFEGAFRQSDGYLRNIIPNGPRHPGSYKNWSIRTGLNFELSDKLSFLLRYTHQDIDDRSNVTPGTLRQGGVTYASLFADPATIPTGYRDVAVQPNGVPGFTLNADIVQLTGNLDLGFADLTSYTQYRHEEAINLSDQDQTGTDIFYSRVPVVDKTFTQELLLTSKPGGRLQWTGGLFYFRYVDALEPVDVGSNRDTLFGVVGSSSKTETIAAYIDLTYELTDRLFLTAGARYSHDEFKDSYVWYFVGDPVFGRVYTYPPRISADKVTPRAVLRYELNDDSSIYASFSKGYKAGLIDLPRPGGPGPVRPENITAYEIGFKHASRALSFNLAGWYYDYSNLQVSSYPAGLAQVTNAASARIYGIEGDVTYNVTPRFQISAGGAWVDAQYKKFPASSRYVLCANPAEPPDGIPNPATGCGTGPFGAYGAFATVPFDASGLRMQRAPKFTATASARYGFDLAGGKMTLAGNYYYTSKVYFDLSQQFYQKSYDLLGLRAEWADSSDHFIVAVFGENVTGSKYYSQILPHGPGIASVGGKPPSYGVSLRVKY